LPHSLEAPAGDGGFRVGRNEVGILFKGFVRRLQAESQTARVWYPRRHGYLSRDVPLEPPIHDREQVHEPGGGAYQALSSTVTFVAPFFKDLYVILHPLVPLRVASPASRETRAVLHGGEARAPVPVQEVPF
jgi:hypothetical protein